MINRTRLAQRTSATPIVLQWSISCLATLAILGPLTLQIGIPIYQALLAAITTLTTIGVSLIAVSDMIRRQCTWYEITPTHLHTRRGILTKDERTIPLAAIQSTSIRWPLVGRLLNYGSIRIEPMGNYPSVLFLIDNPRAWQNALMKTDHPNSLLLQNERPRSPFV
jgi:membrane protein YdbS with pleckstrin-like domain